MDHSQRWLWSSDTMTRPSSTKRKLTSRRIGSLTKSARKLLAAISSSKSKTRSFHLCAHGVSNFMVGSQTSLSITSACNVLFKNAKPAFSMPILHNRGESTSSTLPAAFWAYPSNKLNKKKTTTSSITSLSERTTTSFLRSSLSFVITFLSKAK